MKRYRFVFLFLLLALMVLAITSSALAQDNPPREPTDDEVNAIAKQMYCPVCENIPLDVCPTQACAEWRALVRDKLVEGWSEEQIKEYFVLQFGDRVLAEPPRRGLNWLIYVIPPIAFLGGVVILFRAFQVWQRSDETQLEEEVAEYDRTEKGDEDEYISRLEDELKKL